MNDADAKLLEGIRWLDSQLSDPLPGCAADRRNLLRMLDEAMAERDRLKHDHEIECGALADEVHALRKRVQELEAICDEGGMF